jgi:hypothetical protein
MTATKKIESKQANAKPARAKQASEDSKPKGSPAIKSTKERTIAKKPSALDAAARVLSESNGPLTTGELIDVMAKKGYWTSPGGQTPAATLYSAILRELKTKGKDARFTRAEPGKFALAK